MRKLVNTLITLALFSASVVFAADQTIRIGVAGPFTGPYASFGDQFWLGAQKAVADINSKGGINGNRIELIKADDKCTPKQAAAVAERLVGDKVSAVVGHFCSSSTLAASKIYAKAGVLMITPGSTNPEVTEQGFKTVFRLCGRDDQQGDVAAKFIASDLKAKKIVIIHDNSTYGAGLAETVRDALLKRNIKTALYAETPRGNKDFRSLITKITELHPDAIYFSGLHSDAGPFVQQFREADKKTPIVAGDGIVTTDFVTSAGGHKITKGIYMTFGVDPRTLSSAKQTVKAFQADQIDPEGYTLYSYAAIEAIANALTKTKSLDGKQLAAWLHQNKVNTVLGEKSWDAKGDLNQSNYIMYEWNNNRSYSPK
ncbi:ABC transporter substrate-binding protein [Candidatus Berkiella aquae]|uniref:Branched-chain amino acid ABC transporter substrate-binding protein n=1 Tax=Candidatus Berkiella aquae TaxID=295108 RepID=A0A0Q9YZJ8_9GAMM|nr:branched-chain amino acid ABC transporter substrate-binding protein [Candidatus Berkiella aquae]MCS5712385.1 branched-chain amino acid ABC transporter substrate-binding protein [Candidatus Berkiella aquae]